MAQNNTRCFGFFNGSRICEVCPMKKDCKYVLVFVGFDVMKAVQSEMMHTLPEGKYTDADRMPVLVNQIIGMIAPDVDETLEIFDQVDGDSDLNLAKVI